MDIKKTLRTIREGICLAVEYYDKDEVGACFAQLGTMQEGLRVMIEDFDDDEESDQDTSEESIATALKDFLDGFKKSQKKDS